MRAALGAPLRVDGRPTGVIVVSDQVVRSWTELEMQLLQLAAERLATSIERARITDEQRNVADRLQRALEPTRLPRLHGLTLGRPLRAGRAAHRRRLVRRLRPARRARLGWRSATSSATASRPPPRRCACATSCAASSCAATVRGPGDRRARRARRLDERRRRLPSMVYAELDLRTGGVRWAQRRPPAAGAAARRRVAQPLESLGGSLLGVAATEPWPAAHRRRCAPATGFVLYTDGLVERPGVADRRGHPRALRRRSPTNPIWSGCATAWCAARPDAQRDDVAVLAAALD